MTRATQDFATSYGSSPTGLSPSMDVLSRTFRSIRKYDIAILLPRRRNWHARGLGSSPFARHY